MIPTNVTLSDHSEAPPFSPSALILMKLSFFSTESTVLRLAILAISWYHNETDTISNVAYDNRL